MRQDYAPEVVAAALQFTAILAHTVVWSGRLKDQLVSASMKEGDQHDLATLVAEVRRIADDFASIGEGLRLSADALERVGYPADPHAPGLGE